MLPGAFSACAFSSRCNFLNEAQCGEPDRYIALANDELGRGKKNLNLALWHALTPLLVLGPLASYFKGKSSHLQTALAAVFLP